MTKRWVLVTLLMIEACISHGPGRKPGLHVVKRQVVGWSFLPGGIKMGVEGGYEKLCRGTRFLWQAGVLGGTGGKRRGLTGCWLPNEKGRQGSKG